MYRESDIAFETDGYWVLRVPYGFDVYRLGVTHSTRCARIGFKGDKGLNRAKREIERRKQDDQARTTRPFLKIGPAARRRRHPTPQTPSQMALAI